MQLAVRRGLWMQRKGCFYEAANFTCIAGGTYSCVGSGESEESDGGVREPENTYGAYSSAAVSRSHSEGSCSSVVTPSRFVRSGARALSVCGLRFVQKFCCDDEPGLQVALKRKTKSKGKCNRGELSAG